MGCMSSTTTRDDSQIWTNIHRPRQAASAKHNLDDKSENNGQKVNKRNIKTQQVKMSKTYFEPCLLYVNELGHSNYHLNDLGLYEYDIELSLKIQPKKKRPKCKGLWEDDSFDEYKFNQFGDVTLLRPKEFRNHTGEFLVEDLTTDTDPHTCTTHNKFRKLLTNIELLEEDPYLLQRVLPDDDVPKYDGIFHCRLSRCGLWEDIYVDDRLPASNRGVMFRNQSIWKQLLTKAYAKFTGSFSELEKHGFLDIYRCLTGGTGYEIQLVNTRLEMANTLKRMREALNQGSIVTCLVGVNNDQEYGLTSEELVQVKKIIQVKTKPDKHFTLVELKLWFGTTQWNGPWSRRSAEWDLVESRTDIPASASEGEFYMSIECFMKHFETVTICNLIPEQDKLGSEERSNYITKIYSEWRGSTAGGLNYLRNPKYLIALSDKGIEQDGKIRIVVLLEQTTQKTNVAAIRIKLYKVRIECKQGVILEDIMEDGVCLKRMTVTTSLRIIPGQYLIVPHTDREDIETEFMIAIYTPTPIQHVSYISKLSFRNKSIVSNTAILVTRDNLNIKAGKLDTRLHHVNHLWGKWNFSKEDIHTNEFHKNPQFEICIHQMGKPVTVRFKLLKDNLQPEACTGIRVFKMNEEHQLPYTKNWLESIWNDPVKCHDGSIEGWHWNQIAPTYVLQPGRYIAIAWADKHNYKCTFCLIACSSSGITIKSHYHT